MANHKNKITVLAIGAMLCLLGYKYFHWLIYAASAMVLMSFLFPPIERKIVKYWLLFAEGVNTTITILLLGITFVAVLMPTAIIRKAFRRKKKSGETNFENRKHLYVQSDLENTW